MIWQQIKKLIGQNNAKKQIEPKINDTLTNEKTEVAEAFNHYFVKSVETISNSFPPHQKYNAKAPKPTGPIFNFERVSETQVTKVIDSLKPKRSKDVYEMDSTMIKDLACLLTKPITHIVNISFTQGQGSFPEYWKPAAVVPIFKGADPYSVSNYRPISILPIMSKIIEKLAVDQLICHLNLSQLLHPMQHGFRAHHSTETATVYFLERIKSLMDRGGVVGAVFLDLRKAFDTVNHNILQSKFDQFNFSQVTSNWFNSYLTTRSQCVKVQNTKSTFKDLITGVPQGSILGPILFSLYINDLPPVCQGCEVIMYADDTVIFVKGKDHSEAASQLTKALVNVSNWLNNCHLQLNSSKTVAMFFTKAKKSYTVPDVFISGQRIQIVNK